MQVILLEKVQKLGNLGDLANVKAGYARNFLIPQGKAKPATAENFAAFEAIKADLRAAEEASLSLAQETESKIKDTVCNIPANASEEGKLFGSINAADIVASLADAGFEVEKRSINMPEAIRFVGEYEVSVTLHSDVNVIVKVVVVKADSE